MPETTNNIIRFLNSKSRYELDEIGLEDRTSKILEVKKVLTKKNLVIHLEKKCRNLEIVVSRFFNIIEPLTKRGLPSLFLINDKLKAR